MLVAKEKANLEMLHTYESNCKIFWKRQNYEYSQKISSTGMGNTVGRAWDFLAVKLFCVTL
jgi:hypothetical protein